MITVKGKKVQLLHDTHPDNLGELLLNLRDMSLDFVQKERIHAPLLLPDMMKVCERVSLARQNNERIMIFWDYDVDGISSTAALFLFLRDECGMDVSFRLPHRVDDGYGIKSYHMDEIVKTGTKLVITVDCWTRDIVPIAHAKTLGMDVIVTDHHSCPQTLPECVAVVNPRRSDSLYPFPSLSGSWVVWKVIHALSDYFFPEKTDVILQKYVDIVSLWTVADCMPMQDENRTIVRRGILQSNESHHPFFQTLVNVLKKPITTEEDIWFFVWPLLNSGGRLTSPYQSLATLLADSHSAFEHIQGLLSVNETRKIKSREAYQKALAGIDLTLPMLISIHEDLEHGILWLVAAKLTEQFHKPSIVLTHHGDSYVGSLRAPLGVDLVKILDASAEFIDRYGGHAGAAGCTIGEQNIFSACQSLQEHTSLLFGKLQEPILRVDTVIDPLKITLHSLAEITQLRPFGMGFTSPLFLLESQEYSPLPLGQTGEHLKWNSWWALDIVGFHLSSYLPQFQHQKHCLIGTLTSNTWRDTVTPQFQVVDVGVGIS